MLISNPLPLSSLPFSSLPPIKGKKDFEWIQCNTWSFIFKNKGVIFFTWNNASSCLILLSCIAKLFWISEHFSFICLKNVRLIIAYGIISDILYFCALIICIGQRTNHTWKILHVFWRLNCQGPLMYRRMTSKLNVEYVMLNVFQLVLIYTFSEMFTNYIFIHTSFTFKLSM